MVGVARRRCLLRREGIDTVGPQEASVNRVMTMASELHAHCPLSTWVSSPQHDKPSKVRRWLQGQWPLSER